LGYNTFLPTVLLPILVVHYRVHTGCLRDIYSFRVFHGS